MSASEARMPDLSDLRSLRSLRGFVFDMDGVIYQGRHAIPGAAEFVGRLRAAGIPFLFATNNSTTAPEGVAERLTGMGIPAEPRDVLTSSEVTAALLKKEAPDSLVFVLGEEGIYAALTRYGLETTEDYREATAVVMGMDRALTYARLRDAALAIRRGARFIATNADRTCPMPGGAIPDAGATIAALEHITGRRVELIAGKPSTLILQTALDRMGLPAERCLMVGDRLETDIRMGQEAGLATAVVLTGVSKREDVARLAQPPDFVVENLGELARLI